MASELYHDYKTNIKGYPMYKNTDIVIKISIYIKGHGHAYIFLDDTDDPTIEYFEKYLNFVETINNYKKDDQINGPICGSIYDIKKIKLNDKIITFGKFKFDDKLKKIMDDYTNNNNYYVILKKNIPNKNCKNIILNDIIISRRNIEHIPFYCLKI